jgi:hypothetical protein
VVALDAVVGVLLGSMPGCWKQVLQHHRIGRCPISNDHCRRHFRCADGRRKEPARRRRIPPWRYPHVNDLAELVDRTVDVPPAAADLHIGLVHEPAISTTMTAGSGGISKQRREPLDPPVDGDVVDLDPALGELAADQGLAEGVHPRAADPDPNER